MKNENQQRHRVLDPVERISEVLFGLIMALTFTGTLSVATAGKQDVHTMMLGAIGCNMAWGIVDAVMYVMARLAEHRRKITLLRAVRGAAQPEEAHRIIVSALPPLLASLMRPSDIEFLRQQVTQLPEPDARAPLTKEDILGAVLVFCLVFVSTFPGCFCLIGRQAGQP